MTHRRYIAERQRLTPQLAIWLQPYFSFDVLQVPILVGGTWSYGQTRVAIADGGRVRVSAAWLATCTTNTFLQIVAHELYHVEEWKRQGWFRHFLERLLRPRRKGEWYTHEIIPEEREADARRHEVAVLLMARASELPRMDDEA